MLDFTRVCLVIHTHIHRFKRLSTCIDFKIICYLLFDVKWAVLHQYIHDKNKFTNYNRGRHSHNGMVVGFITTYAIIVYHH
jgi:hypothetical protein